MAITIDVQENPKVSRVGKKDADATVINSGETSGTVEYQVQRKDGQDNFVVSTATDISSYEQVLSCTIARLKVILPGRQWYQVRTRVNGGAWSDWTSFKTRDKTYWTPVAIWTARPGYDTTPTQKRNKTITITNVGKSTETKTSTGTQVVNTDTVYNGTTSVTYTNRGATVVSDDFTDQSQS
jgi:hypothetical protein